MPTPQPFQTERTPPAPDLTFRVGALGWAGGFDPRRSTVHSNPTVASNMQNIRLVDTEARKRFGFADLGAAADNPVIGFARFIDARGITQLVRFTRTKSYVFDDSTDTWTENTPAAGNYIGSNTLLPDTAVIGTVAAPAGLVATNNLLAMVNGNDKVHVWDGDPGGSGVDFFEVAAAPIARYCASFADRLVCAWIGSAFAQRVQWPISGNITDWTGIGSGSNDLVNVPGEIRNLKPLRGRLAIYKSLGIETAIATGDGAAPIAFTPSPGAGVGLLASESLALMSPGEHIFLGSDMNVYIHDLTIPRAVGDPVREFIAKILNHNLASNIHAAMSPDDSEYWLFITTATDTQFPTICLIYNTRTGRWSKELFSDAVSRMLTLQFGGSLTYDAATGTFDAAQGTFDNASSALTEERIVIGQATNMTRIEDPTKFTETTQPLTAATTHRNPTVAAATGGNWREETQVFLSDDVRAIADDGAGGDRTAAAVLFRIGIFNILDSDAPADALITGVEVFVEGYGLDNDAAGRQLDVNLLSNVNAGTIMGGTSAIRITPPQGVGNEAVTIAGSSTNLFGAGSLGRSEFFGATLMGIGLTEVNTGAGELPINIDHVQIRVHYTSLTDTGELNIPVSMETVDTDCGFPGLNKTLNKVKIGYRDVGDAATVVVEVSTDEGNTFEAADSFVTESDGGGYKSAATYFVVWGEHFRIRARHTGSENLVLTDFELSGLIGGEVFGS